MSDLSDLIRGETDDETETKLDVTDAASDKCQQRKNEENKFKKLQMKEKKS